MTARRTSNPTRHFRPSPAAPPAPAALPASDDVAGWAVAYPDRRPGREVVEVLLSRAAVLPNEDREILRLAYEEGLNISRITAAVGAPDHASIRRRIRRLSERILSPRFVFVIAHRDRWPASRRRIATEVVIHGRSMRAAALALGTTLYQVRLHRQAVDALFDAARNVAPAPRFAPAPRAER